MRRNRGDLKKKREWERELRDKIRVGEGGMEIRKWGSLKRERTATPSRPSKSWSSLHYELYVDPLLQFPESQV